MNDPCFDSRFGRRGGAALALTLAALTTGAACGPRNPDNDGGVDDVAPLDATGRASDPRGSDATFNFTWLINGVRPTDPSMPCDAAGVRYIRMVVVDPANQQHRYDEFRFDCALGSYRSPSPNLRAGSYRIYWEAARPDGTPVSSVMGNFDGGTITPALEALNVTRGQNVNFDEGNRPSIDYQGQPTNFATGRGPMEVALRFAQQVNGTSGVECTAAGVASLDWTLRLSNNVPIETHSTREPCTASLARLAWVMLTYDNYSLEVRGYDAMGAQTWQSLCRNLLVTLRNPPATAQHTCLVDRRR